jgi:uncharacterized protein (TIGR02001 family)
MDGGDWRTYGKQAESPGERNGEGLREKPPASSFPLGTKMKKLACSCLLAAGIGLAAPVHAADTFYSQAEIDSKIDLAFGVTFTSSYVSRGYDYSAGPALQGYVEGSYDWAYVGVWASSVKGPLIDPADSAEINLYGGIRPTFGDLTLDLGYARYFYNSTGDLGGELYGKASYEFSDLGLTPGLELYWDPQARTHYGVATASLSLPYDLEVSGGVGTTFRGSVDWNAGISYTYAEALKLDLRYHGSNRNDPDQFRSKFVASVSLESSLSALRALSGH